MNAIQTQVLVVGAGAAGFSAALAAARNGARTLLVEDHGFLGGLSATMTWIGFHDRDYRQVVQGLGAEFVRRLQEEGAASEYVLDPKCSSIVSVDTHRWKCLAMELAAEARVQLLLHTRVVDTLREGERIRGVVIESKSGRREIHASVTIDASGDGDVAARGGVPWNKGRTGDGLVQSPTLVFRLGGVDRPKFIAGCRDQGLNYREWLRPYPNLWEKMMARIEDTPVIICGGFAPLVQRAHDCGDLHVPQTRVVGVKLHRPDQFLVVMTRVLGLDPTDVDSMTDAYQRVYLQVPELVEFFRRYVPGFADSYLLEIAPMLGVRESRRIVGDYTLTAEDLVQGKRFPDAVAMGGYHMDIHRPAGTWVESRNVQAYTIPFRCLVASGVEGLLMAGKCLSATHESLASTRVIPICMAQGEAAGTAAAMAVERGVSARELPIDDLQSQLVEQGAELGQSLGEPNHEMIERIGQLPLDEPLSSGDRDAVSQAPSAWIQ
ncbi:MAG TPA: FAD-dependent oxidoreductase [Candidatus Paceibacterota bacterium]|nr:FAD-dependent oxidoreductase [Verrucomicrobiota bacterium]HRZ45014.1 FAD-dependent oxidoreductase [Candidatus Paceibacterota bacterium]HRZ92686.1 FAD-dependent oxidoreductase [Candidatus Paceibacterota bacterium]